MEIYKSIPTFKVPVKRKLFKGRRIAKKAVTPNQTKKLNPGLAKYIAEHGNRKHPAKKKK